MKSIIHKFHDNKKIYEKIPKITDRIKKVNIPTLVRKKLIKEGLASRSVFRKNTLDTTKVRTAKIAIISPANILLLYLRVFLPYSYSFKKDLAALSIEAYTINPLLTNLAWKIPLDLLG